MRTLRSASPAPSANLSDVWVPPDLNAIGTPSGSPLPHPLPVPTPVHEVVGVEVERVGRKAQLAFNVFCSLVTLSVIGAVFVGIYKLVQHNKAH